MQSNWVVVAHKIKEPKLNQIRNIVGANLVKVMFNIFLILAIRNM